MPINVLEEDLITLAEATSLFPRSERGKRIHKSAIYRFTTRGLRGVLLEWVQAGSIRCTSREAVARFFARLTERAQLAEPAVARSKTLDCDLSRRAQKAGETLDERVFGSRTKRRGSKNGEGSP